MIFFFFFHFKNNFFLYFIGKFLRLFDQVCDSLLNIGPCANISMGEPAFLSEEFTNTTDPDVELVTTSGYGKNGALCVLQRSIRPQVSTHFKTELEASKTYDMNLLKCNVVESQGCNNIRLARLRKYLDRH